MMIRGCAQQSGPAERKTMIDRSHGLPVSSQAKALNISRSSVYYLPRAVPTADLAIMRRMDELHLDFPFAGSRMLRDLLNAEGVERAGSVCRNRFSGLIGGGSAGFRPPRSAAAW